MNKICHNKLDRACLNDGNLPDWEIDITEIDATNLADFFATGCVRHYKKKDIIVHLRDDPDGVFWIAEGYVKVCSFTLSGDERILHIYRSGELFPISNLVKEQLFDAYFGAYTDVVIQRRFKQELLDFFVQQPLTSLQIITQQSYVFNPVLNMHMDTAEQKVVYQLSYLGLRFGKEEGQYTRVELPFTQQDFAGMINISRETVGRILSRLEQDGFIVRGRQSTLLHTERLAELQRTIG